MVEGEPPQKGHIEGAIIRDPRDRVKMTVSRDSRAKEAQTSFELIESMEVGKYGSEEVTSKLRDFNTSLLRVQIHTGRTHQIRVHLSSIGFPVLGDPIYGETDHKRMMLHAHTLRFPDPKNPEEMIEVMAELPTSFS